MLYNGSRTMAMNKRINPIYTQKHYPVFRPELQEEKCAVVFDCPYIISLDVNSDGIRYCGSLDGTVSFNRIATRKKLSDIRKHKVMDTIANRDISFLYDGNTNMVEIYGDANLEEVLIEGIFTNPFAIPTFNKDYDHYPIDEAAFNLVEQLIWAEQTSIEKRIVPDKINDGSETPVAAK